MARMSLAIALAGVAFTGMPAAAQEETTGTVTAPLVAPAPHDSSAVPVQAVPSPAEPAPEGKTDNQGTAKAAENPPPVKAAPSETAESKPAESKPGKPDDTNAEARADDKADGRFTFNRVDDGYVRLDNRTGQVSFCGKRTVGWTCQLVPDDRGVLENEIGRLQEENAALKRNLLANNLPLPGTMKSEPPPAPQANQRHFNLPSDPNIDRMKVMVEKAWRRLVELITALQKDVLKKS